MINEGKPELLLAKWTRREGLQSRVSMVPYFTQWGGDFCYKEGIILVNGKT